MRERERESSPYGERMKRSAFTLIELSIVLVIIGLIVGGVLVGKDLIKAAEIRGTVSQIERFNSATNTFRLKFNSLPGDLKNPDAFGLTNGTSVPADFGNGNGYINRVMSSEGVGTFMEAQYFWHQLYRTDLLNEESAISIQGGPSSKECTDYQYSNTDLLLLTRILVCAPESKLSYSTVTAGGTNGPNIAVFYIRYFASGHHFQLVSSLGNSSTATAHRDECGYTGSVGGSRTCNTLPPLDAMQIDVKIDDGLPMSGMTRATNATVYSYAATLDQTGVNGLQTGYNAPSIGAAGSASCVDNTVTPNIYNTSSSLPKLCSLNIKASF